MSKPSYLYCKHDNFIGGVGIDYICGLCEQESEDAIEEAIANSTWNKKPVVNAMASDPVIAIILTAADHISVDRNEVTQRAVGLWVHKYTSSYLLYIDLQGTYKNWHYYQTVTKNQLPF